MAHGVAPVRSRWRLATLIEIINRISRWRFSGTERHGTFIDDIDIRVIIRAKCFCPVLELGPIVDGITTNINAGAAFAGS